MRVVMYWNRLPKDVVGASSQKVYRARLGRALSTLAKGKVSLTMARGWELLILERVKTFKVHLVVFLYQQLWVTWPWQGVG